MYEMRVRNVSLNALDFAETKACGQPQSFYMDIPKYA